MLVAVVLSLKWVIESSVFSKVLSVVTLLRKLVRLLRPHRITVWRFSRRRPRMTRAIPGRHAATALL
jgi:hypothetical protein